MLSSLANYLLGGNVFGARGDGNVEDNNDGVAEESEQLRQQQRQHRQQPQSQHRHGNAGAASSSLPTMTRLSQVEVEGDDWILIDCTESSVPTGSALEESWYVTPPACFTRAGPVSVETSPLEDLLIEHPSMSVYHGRAVTLSSLPTSLSSPIPLASSSSLFSLDTPPSSLDGHDKENETMRADEKLHRDNYNQRHRRRRHRRTSNDDPTVMVKTSGNSSKQKKKKKNREIGGNNVTGILEDPNQRVASRNNTSAGIAANPLHDCRPSLRAASEKIRVVHLRSAQKMLEKRSAQTLKRSQLDRSNKLHEAFNTKGRRPRRQDRLRVQNSGANNNRKC